MMTGFFFNSCKDDPPEWKTVQEIFDKNSVAVKELEDISIYFDRSGSMVSYARDKMYISLMTKFALTLKTSYVKCQRRYHSFDADIQNLSDDRLIDEIENPVKYRGDTDIKKVMRLFVGDTLNTSSINIIITDGIPLIDFKPDILGVVEEISKWILSKNDFYLLGFQTKTQQFYMFVFGHRSHSQKLVNIITEDARTIPGLKTEYLFVSGSEAVEKSEVVLKVDKESSSLLTVPAETGVKNYKIIEFEGQSTGYLNVSVKGKFIKDYQIFYTTNTDSQICNVSLNVLKKIIKSDRPAEKEDKLVKIKSVEAFRINENGEFETQIKLQLAPIMKKLWYAFYCEASFSPTVVYPEWIKEWSTDNAKNPGSKTPYLYDFTKKLLVLSAEINPQIIGRFYLAIY